MSLMLCQKVTLTLCCIGSLSKDLSVSWNALSPSENCAFSPLQIGLPGPLDLYLTGKNVGAEWLGR